MECEGIAIGERQAIHIDIQVVDLKGHQSLEFIMSPNHSKVNGNSKIRMLLIMSLF